MEFYHWIYIKIGFANGFGIETGTSMQMMSFNIAWTGFRAIQHIHLFVAAAVILDRITN